MWKFGNLLGEFLDNLCYEDLCQFLAQSQKIKCAKHFLNIETQSFEER